MVYSRYRRHPARPATAALWHIRASLDPNGIAVFGRDRESASQVWSRQEGYPGDPRYRDFYREHRI